MEPSLPDLPGLKILRRIGSGATSQVYEALREGNRRKVAVKVIPIQSLQDDSSRLRVEREARTLRSLKHPNIVRLYEFHQTDRDLVLELEYVDGLTLTDWMRRCRTSLIEPKLWILAQLAQALAIAHLDGTIHRDLKPDNVLLTRNGELKLGDFGLAKTQTWLECQVTQPGLIVGSLAYMAPEALSEGKSSFASDIFSFGVIAYELLTGQHPFPHEDVKSLINAICEERGSSRSLPCLSARLESLLLSCLCVDPAQRPSSLWLLCAELMVHIENSGMLDLCKKLASDEAIDGGHLTQALGRKHGLLKKAIEDESQKKTPDKRKLVQLINEFAALFPQDSEIANYLPLLREKSRARVGWIIAGVSILVAGGAAAFVIRKHHLAQAPAPRIEPSRAEAAVPPPARAKERPPVAMGALDMILPSDVRVFIDGMRYSSSALRSLQLKSGSHHVLIERDGFLPIEKTVIIRTGQATKIKASVESDDE